MTIPEVIGGASLNNPPIQPEQLNRPAEGVEAPCNNAAVCDSVLGRLLRELSREDERTALKRRDAPPVALARSRPFIDGQALGHSVWEPA